VDIAIIAGQIGSEAEPTAATFYVGYLLPPVAFAIAWFMAICPSVARFGYGMLQGLAYGLSLCFAFLCCLILVWWRFA
jgi:hypothetical protein